MNFRFLAMLLLTCPALAFAAGVYKWVDANGHVHYSDKAPAYDIELINIKSRPTDPERIASAQQRSVEAAQDEQTAAAEQAAETQKQAERQARRDENCTRAKRALDSLVSATRIYEPLPGGDRRYLDEDEVSQRMTRARADVEEWCTDKPGLQ